MPLPVITLKRLHHRGKDRIGLYFDYNTALISHTRKLEGTTWSGTNKCWYMTETDDTVQKLFKHYKGVAYLEINSLKKSPEKIKKSFTQNKKPSLSKYKSQVTAKAGKQLEIIERKLATEGYSQNSINTYKNMLRLFLGYVKKDASEIRIEDVRDFQYNFWVKNKYSSSTQRQFIAALKHLMAFIPDNQLEVELLVLPKKENKLPKVLSEEEVLMILKSTRNLKHFLVLSLLYSAGFRVSELINLRIEDIDPDRKQIHIRNAKGGKDRYVGLSKHLIPLIHQYLDQYNPDTYLFNGQSKLQYTASSVRKLLKQIAEKAGIKKRVHPHMLRHSYATHLLENGIDIRYIQELLGHHKPETTMIYTHVATKQLKDIKNPLDNLVEKTESDKGNFSNKKFLLSGK